MPVSVTCTRRVPGIRAADVGRDARRLLELLALDAELSIALVDDAEIRRLNATYRKVDKPTDVLAFAMREGDERLHEEILGDVVISLDTAVRQAAKRRVPPFDEVRLLLAHGLLHLLGYDHERSPSDARRMFSKQRELVRLLASTPG